MLKEGLTHTSKVTVTLDNCASAVGSGGLNVFATPSMVALMENAAMNAVAEFLPDGSVQIPFLKDKQEAVSLNAAKQAIVAIRPFCDHIVQLCVQIICGTLGQILGQLLVIVNEDQRHHRA